MQYALAATHQAVDVVPLVAHNHHERHHAQDNIVVKTNERAHEIVVVHIAEVHDDAEQHHHEQADEETHAHRLVAKPLLDLELQVLAELAVTVQEVKLRGVLDFLLLLLSYLVVHHAHLQLVVCPIQQSNESANHEEGPQLPLQEVVHEEGAGHVEWVLVGHEHDGKQGSVNGKRQKQPSHVLQDKGSAEEIGIAVGNQKQPPAEQPPKEGNPSGRNGNGD